MSGKKGTPGAYREPNRQCATCSRPTAAGRDGHGFGDPHHDCARDADGRLLTVPHNAQTPPPVSRPDNTPASAPLDGPHVCHGCGCRMLAPAELCGFCAEELREAA